MARWWAAFIVITIALVIPLLLSAVPPLLDYPNHLARMYILVHDQQDAALSRMYQVKWHIVPNIGIDLTLPLLAKILSLEDSGKVFIALSILLPFFGTVRLHHVIFKQYSYWPLSVALVAYNRLLFTGFLNFLIGIGLALLAASVWEKNREKPLIVRLLSAIIFAILIFFCHLIAVGFYGLLLLCLEFGRMRKLKSLNPIALLTVFLPFLIPFLFYLASSFAQEPSNSFNIHTGAAGGWQRYYLAFMAERNLKVIGLAGAFLTYNRMLDFAALFTISLTTGICLFMRWGKMSFGLAAAFAVLMVAYPFVPFGLMDTAWIDQRLPIMAAFLVFAGFLPEIPFRKAGILIAVTVIAVFIARQAEVVGIWRSHDIDVRDFRSLITVVSEGERVLVVRPEPDADRSTPTSNVDSVAEMVNNDATTHLPAFLVIDRKAFWPLLFTAAAKQPLQVVPPYAALAMPEGNPPRVHELATPEAPAPRDAPYLHEWPQHFDWVIVLRPSAVPDAAHLLPEQLDLIRIGRVAALYKVRK